MNAPGVPDRCARFGAAVVFLTGLGVIFVVGAAGQIPLRRLWIPLFWGGVASIALGWAVGHAAGRLLGEACPATSTEQDHPDAVEENR
jgi:hypothetical protein